MSREYLSAGEKNGCAHGCAIGARPKKNALTVHPWCIAMQMEETMREYLLAIWTALCALAAAICGRKSKVTAQNVSASANENANANGGANESAGGLTREVLYEASKQLQSKHEFDCVKAYFRLIGVIMRHKRWMKPGKAIDEKLRHALELFVTVEMEYARCGFRPVLPLNRLFEMTEDPAEVIALGYAVRRLEGEEPVYFARAVRRRIEKLAASKQIIASGV